MAHSKTIEQAVASDLVSEPFCKSSFLRRRRFIIDSKLQLGMVGAFFLLLAGFLLVLVACLFGPLILDLMLDNSVQENRVSSASRLLVLDVHFWPAVALAFFFVMIIVVRMTHRLAGPLYRFKCVFRELRDGGTARRFKLRDGDYLLREADLLNQALTQIEIRERASRDLCRGLRDIASGADDVSARDVREAITETLGRYEEQRESGLSGVER